VCFLKSSLSLCATLASDTVVEKRRLGGVESIHNTPADRYDTIRHRTELLSSVIDRLLGLRCGMNVSIVMYVRMRKKTRHSGRCCLRPSAKVLGRYGTQK
jgi:hypothetical protein